MEESTLISTSHCEEYQKAVQVAQNFSKKEEGRFFILEFYLEFYLKFLFLFNFYLKSFI